jgi:hypothetical protein
VANQGDHSGGVVAWLCVMFFVGVEAGQKVFRLMGGIALESTYFRNLIIQASLSRQM